MKRVRKRVTIVRRLAIVSAVLGCVMIGLGGAQSAADAVLEPHAASMLRLAANYSASGTHSCKTANDETRSCIVSGAMFGSCIEAESSLRVQDCCPSSQICKTDQQGRATDCRRGGVSTRFTMNYCIFGY